MLTGADSPRMRSRFLYSRSFYSTWSTSRARLLAWRGFYLLRNNLTSTFFRSLLRALSSSSHYLFPSHGTFSLRRSTGVVKINRTLETFEERFSTSKATCRGIYQLRSAGSTVNTEEPRGRRIYEHGEQERARRSLRPSAHTYARRMQVQVNVHHGMSA